MEDVSGCLRDARQGEEAIRRENFQTACVAVPEDAERLSLHVQDFGSTAEIPVGELLLEALESAGLPIIGACRSGICGACKCQVTSGETESTSVATLTETEMNAGFVLACSSKARSDLVIAL